MTHLGDRISALVDGELDHESRDRMLAHVAHCASCRQLLEAERAAKQALATARTPDPSARLLAALHALAQPGPPLPPRARVMPQGPVVPVLPAPGRAPRGRRGDSRRPAGQGSGQRTAGRARYAAVGALSVAGLVLGTAFAAGAPRQAQPPVVTPAAELSVEHTAVTTGVTMGDPGLGVASGFGDVTYAPVVRR